MASYQITAPDGHTLEINAPDGASQEDIMAYAQSQYKPQETQQPAPKSQFLNTDAINKPYPDIAGFLGLPDREAAGNRSFANVMGSMVEPILVPALNVC